MLQFEVWRRRGGERDLMLIHTERFDYFYGFRKFVTTLKD